MRIGAKLCGGFEVNAPTSEAPVKALTFASLQ